MKTVGYASLAVLSIVALPWIAAAADSSTKPKVIVTKAERIGQGSARGYVALDANGEPLALGVSLDKGALKGLPTMPNKTSRCFDNRCVGDYERVFMLPEGPAAKALSPFKWIMLNWNPHGHEPPAPPPWAEPHFDFHFYTADRAAVMALRPGTCGELIDCADFEKARKPVPARYIHRDHIDVGAAVPAMGNHLINSKAPELAKDGPKFTHTFIFGAYDGHITFYEPMITQAYLVSRPDMCAPIKQPQSWESDGYYPTKYCVRYLERTERYTVSLEDFVKRTTR